MNTSAQVVKLFDRKFMANTLRNKEHCSKCRVEYSSNYDKLMGESHVKSNRPFLLHCGHAMCENCIYQHHRNLTCSVCSVPIQIPMEYMRQSGSFAVRDFFDMNFFLLGEIVDLRFYSRQNVCSLFMAGARQVNVVQPQVVKCGECEHTAAAGNCRFCKVNYCNHCFDMVHMHSKVLKKHNLVPLDQQHFGDKRLPMLKPLICRRHRHVADRFCRKCQLICCGFCCRADHNGHGWVSLCDENQKHKEDLTLVLDTVKISREHLRNAQKVIESVYIIY